MDTLKIVAIDCETFPIGPMEVSPKMVCCSIAQLDGYQVAGVVMAECEPELEPALREILEDEGTLLVGHNLAFDLGVVRRRFPALKDAIWKKLHDGLCTDTKIREKLLNLSTFGALDMMPNPAGSGGIRLGYSLADLEKKYLGLDRSEQKTEDSWRVNYHLLAGQPASEYPPEAYQYSLDDSVGTLRVYQAQQESVRSAKGFSSLSTEGYQTACDFALHRITATGFRVDHAKVAEIRAMLERELAEDKIHLLYESGVLRRGEPSKPYANQIGRALELLGLDAAPADWSEYREALAAEGVKFTKPTDESRNMKRLAQVVVEASERAGLKVKLTETEEVCTRDEVIEDLEPHSPVLAQYGHRQRLQKLVTTELECVEFAGQPAERVHFNFDVVVETGRTSSKGGGKRPLYPARNGQNVDPRARPMFVPDDNTLLASIDYSGMELFTTAQTAIRIFGRSRMAELINEGVDLHAYLGAYLALRMHPQFRAEAESRGVAGDPMALYHAFLECKSSTDPEVKKFFKHYRTFAKPTNLGYPGGLGPNKFVTYAKGTFGVICTLDQAKEFREVWRATFPEVKLLHDYLSAEMKDANNPVRYDEDFEREMQPFCYTSELGMHRANASYCAAANGWMMQTPGAEGAKWGMFMVQRECDGGQLAGCKVLDFVHDEIIFQTSTDDLTKANAEVRAAQQIMEQAHQGYCPDVKVSTSACLMRRWYKEAEPVLDSEGRLRPWEPALQ